MIDDNVIPLFQHEPDWVSMIRYLEKAGVPVTRENYLRLIYFGNPPEWSAEAEDDLPPFLRDDSRSFEIGRSPPAQKKTGYLHLTDEQFDDDLYYRLAADQGLAQAQYNLGVMYEKGEGVPQDYAQAVKFYRLAAAQGHAWAQYNLGLMCHDGRGVPQDYAQAKKYYRLAADQGDVNARNDLGVMYGNGHGVPQDYAQAVKYYRLAADRGYAPALHNLGIQYAKGQGAPQDYVEAYKWFNLAAAQSFADASKFRDDIGLVLTSTQIAQAQQLSREWRPR